jgi:hypothetical protein
MWPIINYYDPLPQSSASCARGEIWWAGVPRAAHETLVTRVFPESASTARVELRRLASLDGSNSRRSAKSIPVVSVLDIRPVIIISKPGEVYHDRAWHGGCWHLVAPVLSLRDPDTDEYRCASDFLWEVATYSYPSLFYLPSDTRSDVHEAVVHLDRLMTVHTSWLLEPRQAKLSVEAMRCLGGCMGLYLNGRCTQWFTDAIATYREQMGSDPSIRTSLGQ